VVDSKKLSKCVNSLANDVNDETPWQKLNDGKQPFLWNYHCTVMVDQCSSGCMQSPTSTVLILK